jgi:hypothetical protein
MTDSDPKSTQARIDAVFQAMSCLVQQKNQRYGDSAIKPLRIFSNLPEDEGIKVRLDDKLNRIIHATEIRKNDIADIMGYLCLFCVSRDWLTFDDLID